MQLGWPQVVNVKENFELSNPKLSKSVLKNSNSKKTKFGASNCQKNKITTYFETKKCPTMKDEHRVGNQTNQGGTGQL